MRIIIDLQGLQSKFSGNRGVGRYTENIVKNLLKNNKDHEIYLALNGIFSDSIDDIRTKFKGLVNAEHFLVWQNFSNTSVKNSAKKNVIEAAEIIREEFLNSFQPDIIFSTNLQEGLIDCEVVNFFRTPL